MYQIQTGILYLVPTPIGNLEDITIRSIRILREVDLILAEDTRHSGMLLKHFDIENKLVSFHQHNEHKVTTSFIDRLHSGKNLALICDAGTPGISDAGFLIVRECVKQNIRVVCLPGATAFVPALIESGFPSNEFLFTGFLPVKKGRQKKLLQMLAETRTVIIYESPMRLVKLLDEVKSIAGPQRLISISRELTKVHEETLRGTADELHKHFSSHPVKGEFVVVIAPADNEQ